MQILQVCRKDLVVLIQSYVLQEETVPTLQEQPACIKGGTMRDYQLVGVNFFITLYNNGLSGILGDEMGLVCLLSLPPERIY